MREYTVEFLLEDEDWARLQEAARREGITVGEYVRDKLFGEKGSPEHERYLETGVLP